MQKAGSLVTQCCEKCLMYKTTKNKSLFFLDSLGAISIPWITAGVRGAVSTFIFGMLKFSLCA